MSVSVQGFTVDPHTIRDQETQRPKPWTSIISATKADGLAKELKARVEGEVRFDDMSSRTLLDRCLELPPSADRRRDPEDHR